MLSRHLKILFAAAVALGLAPLADAHTCQPGVYSVDPNHQMIIICNLLICWGPPHTCVPRMADLGDALGNALLP